MATRLEEVLSTSQKAQSLQEIEKIINSRQEGKTYFYYTGFIMKDKAKKEEKRLREISGFLNYSASKNYCSLFQIKHSEDVYFYFFRR